MTDLYIPAAKPIQYLLQVSGCAQALDKKGVVDLATTVYGIKCKWGDIVVCKGSHVQSENVLPTRWRSLYVSDGYDLLPIVYSDTYVMPGEIPVMDVFPYATFTHWSNIFHQLKVSYPIEDHRQELIRNIKVSSIEDSTDMVMYTYVVIQSKPHYLIVDTLLPLLPSHLESVLSTSSVIFGTIRPVNIKPHSLSALYTTLAPDQPVPEPSHSPRTD